MQRFDVLRSLFDTSGKGLEIGPSFNPLLRKADGYDVEILDHLDAEGLRSKYKDADVDLGKIEAVDYVSDGGSITEIVGKRNVFDFCIALHVIEHTVDLVGFLVDCENLLKESGVLVLAVPDKRFSFDVLRPVCTTGDVVQAYLEGRTRHSPGKLFDELRYNVLRGGLLAWSKDQSGDLAFFRTREEAQNLFSHFQATGEFVDIHAWQFTPSSFRLIIRDLNAFGFIQLKESAFVEADGEFYMTLCKTGAGCPIEAIELAKRVVQEQKEIAALTSA